MEPETKCCGNCFAYSHVPEVLRKGKFTGSCTLFHCGVKSNHVCNSWLPKNARPRNYRPAKEAEE